MAVIILAVVLTITDDMPPKKPELNSHVLDVDTKQTTRNENAAIKKRLRKRFSSNLGLWNSFGTLIIAPTQIAFAAPGRQQSTLRAQFSQTSPGLNPLDFLFDVRWINEKAWLLSKSLQQSEGGTPFRASRKARHG